jgi:hypothetical protein
MFNRRPMSRIHLAIVCFIGAIVWLNHESGLARNSDIDLLKIETTILQKNLWTQDTWLRLGHYSCSNNSCRTTEDGNRFFLADDGKNNPKNELLSFVQALRTIPAEPTSKSHAACRFPARLTWLSDNTGKWDVRSFLDNCPDYKRFENRLPVTDVSFVFSSYYLNNPSSAFGHTLLKLKKRNNLGGTSDANDLLSDGINYAANPTTSNPVLYAVMGIVGGFKGTFANMPYYYKVREYGDFESRDLWEYSLDLTQNEITLLIRHIWELGEAEFDYFYLSENCALFLLKILDAAAPRLNLESSVPFWVLPIDSVKAVQRWPGLVKEVNYRPSSSAILATRYDLLSKNEKQSFHQIVKSYQITDATSVNVVDAVIDQFDFQFAEKLAQKDDVALAQKHKLLTLRSRRQEPSNDLKVPRPKAPHESHDSLKLSILQGQVGTPGSRHDVTYLGARFSLHDLTDPMAGVPPGARLEMFNFEAYYDNDDESLHLGRFRFVGIEALNPWHPLWKKPSWRFDLGAERIRDERCDDCLAALMGGSIGASYQWTVGGSSLNSFSDSPNGSSANNGLSNQVTIKSYDPIQLTAFTYLNARVRGGEFREDNLAAEFGPSIGFNLNLPLDFNILAEWEYRTILHPSAHERLITSLSAQKTFAKKWGIRASYSEQDKTAVSNRDVDFRAGVIWFE